MLFELAQLGDLDKPLTQKMLSNPDHKVTKHILYLYSMESFIYADMNKASREKDKTKIKHYGAFAATQLHRLLCKLEKNEQLKGQNHYAL